MRWQLIRWKIIHVFGVASNPFAMHPLSVINNGAQQVKGVLLYT